MRLLSCCSKLVKSHERNLRTCVYSRYARLKATEVAGFCQTQVSPGLAVDFREEHQKMFSAQNNSFKGLHGQHKQNELIFEFVELALVSGKTLYETCLVSQARPTIALTRL